MGGQREGVGVCVGDSCLQLQLAPPICSGHAWLQIPLLVFIFRDPPSPSPLAQIPESELADMRIAMRLPRVAQELALEQLMHMRENKAHCLELRSVDARSGGGRGGGAGRGGASFGSRRGGWGRESGVKEGCKVHNAIAVTILSVRFPAT